MKTINGFDEEELPQDQTVEEPKQPYEEFSQVFQALGHNLQVAENVFARVAKKRLRSFLCTNTSMSKEKAEALWPKWSLISSIVFKPPTSDVEMHQRCKELMRIVDTFAEDIKNTSEDRELVLPSSLSVDISLIGQDVFKFTLKQKWTVL